MNLSTRVSTMGFAPSPLKMKMVEIGRDRRMAGPRREAESIAIGRGV